MIFRLDLIEESHFKNIFRILFLGFTFSIYSCLFPTGVSATFSSLTLVMAIFFILSNTNSYFWSNSSMIGYFLSFWLFISLTWSEGTLAKSFEAFFEYRFFLFLPILSIVLARDVLLRNFSLKAFYVACFIALSASYLIWFGVIKGSPFSFSLANRIYHGFIMSIFFGLLCLGAINGHGYKRILMIVVAVFVFFNVFFIETGRTAYLQMSVVLGFILLRVFGGRNLWVAIGIWMLGVCAIFFTSESFFDRVLWTYQYFMEAASGSVSFTARLARIEFYRVGSEIALAAFPFGVGVGGLELELQEYFDSGKTKILFDNLHNEYLNMVCLGGIIALIAFCAYWYILFNEARGVEKNAEDVFARDAVKIIVLTAVVGMLFNSSIKDYGEKHALMALLPVFLGGIQERNQSIMAWLRVMAKRIDRR